MQNNPQIKVYLTDLSGTHFFAAVGDGYGNYTIATSTDATPILTLPKEWDKTKIEWKRDPNYLGVFRFQTQGFTFVDDARAILLNLFYIAGGGIQASCIMRIDQFVDVVTGYETAYEAEIDFSTVDDQKYNQPAGANNPQTNGELSAETLDSQLYQYIESFGDTEFNLPVFFGSTGDWVIPTGIDWLVHDGIKLLYQATFASTATVANPLVVGGMGAYNWGQTGSGTNEGQHMIPALAPYNIVQNNGTTTFIGNDILEPFLKTGAQTIGANALNGINEVQFSGVNNSQPWSRQNNSLTDLLLNSTGSVDMYANVSGEFLPSSAIACVGTAFKNAFMAFVMWEFGPGTNPPPAGLTFINNDSPLSQPLPGGHSGMIYTPIYSIPLGTGSFFTVPAPSGPFSITVPVTLKQNCSYVFGIIVDNAMTGSAGDALDDSNAITYTLVDLNYTFKSKFDYGASGVPIPAPMLNSSVFPVMRPGYLLNAIAKNLPTLTTDVNGFPVPITTPINGQSNYLNDTSAPLQGDFRPSQIGITSAYCIHDLQGQPYVSISLNQFFNFFKKVAGCGMSIDADGVTLRMEKLSHYFQDVMIMNLDDYQGVAKLSIKPFNDLTGANLKLGYTKQDTNTDFGIEVCNSELYFNTPAWKLPNTIDWEETDIVVEPYTIEKIRAQQVSQPIGSSFDPASPSSDNTIVAFYCQPTKAGFVLPDAPLYPIQPYDPDNNPFPVTPYQLTQRNGVASGVNPPFSPAAQNTDSTAATAPYLNGFYYPDTVFNNELSPSRALERDGGALLHSGLDNMDAEKLAFRNSSVMQYNNVELALSGTESNLQVGAGASPVNEFSDKLIGGLPSQLFRPYIFTIDTVAPVNMWEIMNTNPNGYIQFTWKGVIFKMYVWTISQMLAASGHTSFEGLAHPSTTNEQMINA